MPRPSPSARNATSSTWRRTGGTRSSARSCSILGLASLRLDDFLCSRLLGPAPDGGIQFAMTFDKRHKRGMFDADDMELAPESMPALPWQCVREGFLAPITGWSVEWMHARRQGGPAEGCLFRNFRFKRSDGNKRFLSSKLAFAAGSPTIDLVRIIAVQLLRLPPLSLSKRRSTR
mmetsp:Transcript_18028/g.41945  ORF Transcript_18028/g.41945 Transcript_18028/m.41945 type:complete len:175 (-) Transcript_18028:419-943(-)